MLKHDEIVLRSGRSRPKAHNCRGLSLTDEKHLTFRDVGTVVACPECGRRWKVSAVLFVDDGLRRHPTWKRRRLPWPSYKPEGQGGLTVD